MRGRRVDDAKLRELWITRLSDKEIAARLGHHRSVIRRRAEALGLMIRRKVWNEQMKVSVVVDDENRFSVGSWWTTAPEFAIKEFRSQLEVAQCIWPELKRYAIVEENAAATPEKSE